MCKRRNIKLKASSLCTCALGFVALLLLPAAFHAQGGEGRSDVAVTTHPVSSKRYRKPVKYRAPRVVHVTAPSIPVNVPAPTGTLALFINERGTEVRLSAADGDVLVNKLYNSPRLSPMILSNLSPGVYTLLVKKPGYFDESRKVSIVPAKRRSARVYLLPKMALLTVTSNLPDAQIEVDNVGKFTRQLRKYPVKPGIYRVSVHRTGFIPMSSTVNLKTAGQEQNITFVLLPIRIESLLEQASDKIRGGDYRTAGELSTEVLQLNAAHGKANLLYGLTKFYVGDRSAAGYFIKAVRNGATVRLPVKVRSESGGKLTDAELSLDLDEIALRTAGFDFRIPKTDVYDLRHSSSQDTSPYLDLKGKGDFYGRTLEQNLQLYSSETIIRPNTVEVYCATSAGRRSCASDIDIIFQLISDWRSSLKTNTASK